MTVRHFGWIGALLIAAGFSAGSARAELIAGNFGPGDSYQTGGSLSWATGFDPNVSINFSTAVAFTNSTSKTFALHQFRFAANYQSGTNQLTAAIYGGSSDLNTASVLESFTFSAPTPLDSFIYTATSLVHPLILPGETYFIVLSEPITPAPFWGWQWNDQGQNGYLARSNSDPWTAQTFATPVFDVRGRVPGVPEPSSLLLATLGLVSVIAAKVTQGTRARRIASPGRA